MQKLGAIEYLNKRRVTMKNDEEELQTNLLVYKKKKKDYNINLVSLK